MIINIADEEVRDGIKKTVDDIIDKSIKQMVDDSVKEHMANKLDTEVADKIVSKAKDIAGNATWGSGLSDQVRSVMLKRADEIFEASGVRKYIEEKLDGKIERELQKYVTVAMGALMEKDSFKALVNRHISDAISQIIVKRLLMPEVK